MAFAWALAVARACALAVACAFALACARAVACACARAVALACLLAVACTLALACLRAVAAAVSDAFDRFFAVVAFGRTFDAVRVFFTAARAVVFFFADVVVAFRAAVWVTAFATWVLRRFSACDTRRLWLAPQDMTHPPCHHEGMSEPGRPITEAEYSAWLEHRLPQMAEELTALLPQEARDAGMRIEWNEAHLDQFLADDCPACGTPGPQRHLSAVGGCRTCAAGDLRPVCIPVRSEGILTYDVVLPMYPALAARAPLRNRIPRVSRCYPLASGAMVHIKPGCRC